MHGLSMPDDIPHVMQPSSTEESLADHRDNTSALVSANPGSAAPPLASHKGRKSYRISADATSEPLVSHAEAATEVPAKSVSASMTGLPQNTRVAMPRQRPTIGCPSAADKAAAADEWSHAKTSSQSREASLSRTEECTNFSLNPAGASSSATPHSSPSISRQEQQTLPGLPQSGERAAQGAQAPSPPAQEANRPWQEVRRSRRKQPLQEASFANGAARKGLLRAPLQSKASLEQAPWQPHAAPQQSHRMYSPGDAAAQNGLPEPGQAAIQGSSATPAQSHAAQQPCARPGLPEACSDEDDCVVCLDNARGVLFLPCGHMVSALTVRLPLRQCLGIVDAPQHGVP